jgi:hypothetical protein
MAAIMAKPTVIDIPHSLGREEARRRIASGLSGIESRLPAGGSMKSAWSGEDRLDLTASVMGQTIPAKVDIGDSAVTVSVTLPMMLSMMAAPATALIRKSGERLLASPAPATDV